MVCAQLVGASGDGCQWEAWDDVGDVERCGMRGGRIGHRRRAPNIAVSKFSAFLGSCRVHRTIRGQMLDIVPVERFSILKHLAAVRHFALNFEAAAPENAETRANGKRIVPYARGCAARYTSRNWVRSTCV